MHLPRWRPAAGAEAGFEALHRTLPCSWITMAGEVSPFALLSAFASASPPHSDEPSPGSARGSSSLSRVSSRTVGFHEPPAVALEPSPKPSACSLADRQHSMGSLGQLLRAAQAEPTPPRPRLSIQTCRSLKAPARGRRVLRIAEDEEGPGGSTSDLLGTTAPSHAAPAGLGMHRSSSIDIGPSRCGRGLSAGARWAGRGVHCQLQLQSLPLPARRMHSLPRGRQRVGVQGRSTQRSSGARGLPLAARAARPPTTIGAAPSPPPHAGCPRPRQPQRRCPTR